MVFLSHSLALLNNKGSQCTDPITIAKLSATSLFSGILLKAVEASCIAGHK